jgi:hypothetical protein
MRPAENPDIRYWSASEARLVLAPHLSTSDLRRIIRCAGLEPRGSRHSSSLRGRPAKVYLAEDLIALLAPFS